uniref:Uncharacterized protein n=1 Tax=Opuntia streptacantha TaxID=393608 RepID=A0A7C9FD54_OPUST
MASTNVFIRSTLLQWMDSKAQIMSGLDASFNAGPSLEVHHWLCSSRRFRSLARTIWRRSPLGRRKFWHWLIELRPPPMMTKPSGVLSWDSDMDHCRKISTRATGCIA